MTIRGIQLEWQGKAENEIGIVKSIDKDRIHAIMQSCRSEAEIPIYRGNHSISDADELLNSYSLLLNSEVIAIDPNYYRPTEVDLLIGNPSKAKSKLGWQAKTKLEKLVEIMVASDFKKVVEKGY